MFHVSLLKAWRAADVQEDQPDLPTDIPEIEEPYWEIEKILRWRKFKINKKIIKQYLVLWRGFPINEASWITQDQCIRPELLREFIQDDKPVGEKL